MSWADLQAMLADAAAQPAILVVCALLVFAAGAFAGSQARRRERSQDNWPDAGDTHGSPPHATSQIPPFRPPPIRVAVEQQQATVPQRRRVRAGTCAPQLKPSFDSRRQSVDVPHHPV